MTVACPLTRRQLQVLRLVLAGRTYKQAGLELGITRSTVRSHMSTAYGVLGVADIVQACALMLRHGWVTADELLEDYDGLPYTTARRQPRGASWLPSPAQRLYLDSFDVLLADRSDAAADTADFMFGVLCRVRGCPDRRRDRAGIDTVLLGVALGVTRTPR